MTDLDEAIAIVEAAGYTVTNERMLLAYYQSREKHNRILFRRAEKGDWLAAESLIQHSTRALHRLHSPALQDFVLLVLSRALSKRPMSSARTPAKRLKYPLLAALLGSGRKDFVRLEQARRLKNALQAYSKELTDHDLKLILGKTLQGGGSKRDALIKWLTRPVGGKSAEMRGGLKTLKKWIVEAKSNSSR